MAVRLYCSAAAPVPRAAKPLARDKEDGGTGATGRRRSRCVALGQEPAGSPCRPGQNEHGGWVRVASCMRRHARSYADGRSVGSVHRQFSGCASAELRPERPPDDNHPHRQQQHGRLQGPQLLLGGKMHAHNLALRQANVTGDGTCDDAKPVDQYWYDIEPSYIEVRCLPRAVTCP